jgi:uncharacterized protein YoxC
MGKKPDDDFDIAEAWRTLADKIQVDHERTQRMIEAIEANTNSNNRLAQALERKSSKTRSPVKTRRSPTRKAVVSERAAAIAKAALARHKSNG